MGTLLPEQKRVQKTSQLLAKGRDHKLQKLLHVAKPSLFGPENFYMYFRFCAYVFIALKD